MADPSFTSRRESIERCSAEHDRVRPERNGLEHIRSTPEATVDDNVHVNSHGRDNLRQDLHRRNARIDVSSAVIADDNAVAAVIRSELGIICTQDAFDEQFSGPKFA
jgi:hypothetical protein